MKPRTMAAVTLVSAAILVFSGCGENSTPETAPTMDEQQVDKVNTPTTTPEPSDDDTAPFSQGTYKISSEYGAEVQFDLPTSPDHPAVAEVEAYRQAVGEGPVTYVVAEIDNRQGTEAAEMSEVQAFDTEGNQYLFEPADYIISEWDTSDDQLFEMWMDAQDSLEFDVPYAAKGDIVLIYEGDDLPDSFTRVSAWPHIIGSEMDAEPVE